MSRRDKSLNTSGILPTAAVCSLRTSGLLLGCFRVAVYERRILRLYSEPSASLNVPPTSPHPDEILPNSRNSARTHWFQTPPASLDILPPRPVICTSVDAVVVALDVAHCIWNTQIRRSKAPPLPYMTLHRLVPFAPASIQPSWRSTSHYVTNISIHLSKRIRIPSMILRRLVRFVRPSTLPSSRSTAIASASSVLRSNRLQLPSMSIHRLVLPTRASTAPSSTSTSHCKNITIVLSNAPPLPSMTLRPLVPFSPTVDAAAVEIYVPSYRCHQVLRSKAPQLPSMSPPPPRPIRRTRIDGAVVVVVVALQAQRLPSTSFQRLAPFAPESTAPPSRKTTQTLCRFFAQALRSQAQRLRSTSLLRLVPEHLDLKETTPRSEEAEWCRSLSGDPMRLLVLAPPPPPILKFFGQTHRRTTSGALWSPERLAVAVQGVTIGHIRYWIERNGDLEGKTPLPDAEAMYQRLSGSLSRYELPRRLAVPRPNTRKQQSTLEQPGRGEDATEAGGFSVCLSIRRCVFLPRSCFVVSEEFNWAKLGLSDHYMHTVVKTDEIGCRRMIYLWLSTGVDLLISPNQAHDDIRLWFPLPYIPSDLLLHHKMSSPLVRVVTGSTRPYHPSDKAGLLNGWLSYHDDNAYCRYDNSRFRGTQRPGRARISRRMRA
ncbi:hypothetical protein C8F01DRAFT_1248024 [Mycena amicta]|nr:hypothetical protein C8F01DRAFT_1248024 [Mycena amicta]